MSSNLVAGTVAILTSESVVKVLKSALGKVQNSCRNKKNKIIFLISTIVGYFAFIKSKLMYDMTQASQISIPIVKYSFLINVGFQLGILILQIIREHKENNSRSPAFLPSPIYQKNIGLKLQKQTLIHGERVTEFAPPPQVREIIANNLLALFNPPNPGKIIKSDQIQNEELSKGIERKKGYMVENIMPSLSWNYENDQDSENSIQIG